MISFDFGVQYDQDISVWDSFTYNNQQLHAVSLSISKYIQTQSTPLHCLVYIPDWQVQQSFLTAL